MRVLSEDITAGVPMGRAVVLAKGDTIGGRLYEGGAHIDEGREAGDRNGARKECVDELRGKEFGSVAATGSMFAAALDL